MYKYTYPLCHTDSLYYTYHTVHTIHTTHSTSITNDTSNFTEALPTGSTGEHEFN